MTPPTASPGTRGPAAAHARDAAAEGVPCPAAVQARAMRWVAGLAAALSLVACLDGADPADPFDQATDADVPLDAAEPDADRVVDADLAPRCAVIDAAEVLAPPGLIDRGPCPGGHAVAVVGPSGARIDVRLVPLDATEDAAVELWWPAPDGPLRVDRRALDDGATLTWGGPADSAIVVVSGSGRWRLTATAEARPTAAVTISGAVGAWRRVVDEDGLGPEMPFSAAGARVDLLDVDDLLVAAGRVNRDGRLTLNAEVPDGPAQVRLVSETRALDIPVRVGPEGDLPWAEVVAEVHGSAEVDVALDPEGAAARAWFVAGTAADGLRALEPWLPAERLPGAPPVRYRWRPGFSEPCGSCFRPGAAPLIELGGRLGDPDEWDRAVIIHELGHYVAAVFSRDDSGGGPHDGSPIEPAVAWSEGLATFMASWPASPVQLDYALAGVARLDVEAMPQPEAFGTADGRPDGPVSERLVAAVLWDLFDDPDADDDPVALGSARVFTPLFEALPGPWVDRGAPGIDLIDYLDALWCTEPPAEALTVLDAREVPHAPMCRLKSAGSLSLRARSAGRVVVEAAVGGYLRFSDGLAVSVTAGDVVERTIPAGGIAGAVLDHPGGRAVLTLDDPPAAPVPRRRRAGAWEALVSLEREPRGAR